MKRSRVGDNAHPSSKRRKTEDRNYLAFSFHDLTLNDYFSPSGIRCLSLRQDVLLVGRLNSAIELWHVPPPSLLYPQRERLGSRTPLSQVQQPLVLLAHIPARVNTTLERLLWLSSSHFVSVGLQGCLTVWSIETLLPVLTRESHGGAIWDMDIHAVTGGGTPPNSHVSEVIFGCSDGVVRMIPLEVHPHARSVIDQVEILEEDCRSFGAGSLSSSSGGGVSVSSDVDVAVRVVRFSHSGDYFGCAVGSRFLAFRCHEEEEKRSLTNRTRNRTRNPLIFSVIIGENDSRISCMEWIECDKCVVIGDSSGKLFFCDVELDGSIIRSIQTHRFDVLNIVSFRNERSGTAGGAGTAGGDFGLVSCGMDGQVVLFEKVARSSDMDANRFALDEEIEGESTSDVEMEVGEWSKVSSRRPSHHDILAMVPVQGGAMLNEFNFVLFGGIDGRIMFTPLSAFHEISTIKNACVNAIPRAGMAGRFSPSKRLLLTNSSSFDLDLFWTPPVSSKFPPANEKVVVSVSDMDVISNPIHLCRISTKKPGGWDVSDHDISPNGAFVGIVTMSEVQLLSLSYEIEVDFPTQATVVSGINLTKERSVPSGRFLRFLSNSSFFVATWDGSICLVRVKLSDSHEIVDGLLTRYPLPSPPPAVESCPNVLAKTLVSTSVSPDKKWVVFTFGSWFAVFHHSDEKPFLRLHWVVPVVAGRRSIYRSGFLPGQSGHLYVLVSGQGLARFDVCEKRTLENGVIANFVHSRILGPIRSILSASASQVVFTTSKSLYVAHRGKRFRVRYVDMNRGMLSTTFLAVIPIGLTEVLLLKFLWKKFQLSLPPVVWRKRFGT